MLIEQRITENGIETVNKAEIAVARLREFEPPEGYYLAFSGGKDSVVIYDLAVKAGVKFDAHYNLTTVDPPELVKFIRQQYPDVQRHRPEKNMWQLIIENGMPPTRLMRYCCRILKERGGSGRRVITGVRRLESNKRQGRRMVENCLSDGTKTFLNPIIDWGDGDVWQYIRENNIKYCSLYDEGFKRLGCVMCPMGNTRLMLKDAARWPKIYNQYLRTFDKMLAVRREKELPTNFKTAEDVMRWWIYNPPKGDPDQTILFE
jgi:phosphoadenosine phosphosulfate reductase